MRILVKRAGAFGDVLDTTPVIRHLKEKYPEAEIAVQTQYPEVFTGNADVVVAGVEITGEFDQVIDLNMSYENMLRRVPQYDAYMQTAFPDYDGVRRNVKNVLAYGTPPDLGVDWSKTVAIHPAVSWPQRTIAQWWWEVFATVMVFRGYHVVSIGTLKDHSLACPQVIDTRSKLKPHEQAAVLNACRVFTCVPSGPFALAMATQVPVVCMVTMSRPENISIYERNGVVGWGVKLLMANIECSPCEGKLDKPVTYFPCARGDNKCVTLFDPEKVADVTEAVGNEYAKAS